MISIDLCFSDKAVAIAFRGQERNKIAECTGHKQLAQEDLFLSSYPNLFLFVNPNEKTLEGELQGWETPEGRLWTEH